MISKKLYISDDVLNNNTDDFFGHKNISEAITDAILDSDPPLTIGIFGSWGSGKSSLIALISKQLTLNNVKNIHLDAWRYSTVSNLNRAFLAHFAYELEPDNPKTTIELEKELYATFIEPKGAPNDKPLWLRIFNLLISFISILVIYSLIALLFTFVIALLENKAIDYIKFLNFILNTVYIPMLGSIITIVKPYLEQKIVSINHLPISSEELFSKYFSKLVEGVKTDRLVIFVDNIDRLNNEKIKEALESIKVFVGNKKCIFVVACDDNVIRSVINGKVKILSDDSAGNINTKNSEGEQYLDKFFQQTFRLPEFMEINLYDYATNLFQKTQLFDEFKEKAENIENLISVILPYNVCSPRKVKRLLNEFIAYYEIVRKREDQSILSAGKLTSNLECMGKFSTLRGEYPEFYKLLIKKPNTLKLIHDYLQTNEENKGKLEKAYDTVDPIIQSDLKLTPEEIRVLQPGIISYLLRTLAFPIEDIETYIYLSQDQLSLDVDKETYRKIYEALANNDKSQFRNIFSEIPEIDTSDLVAQCTKLVDIKLKGVEKMNGVEVIISNIPNSISNSKLFFPVLLKNLPIFTDLTRLSPVGLLYIYKYAKLSDSNFQKTRIIQNLITRLIDLNGQKEIFPLLLEYYSVIHPHDQQLILNWFNGYLPPNSSDETDPESINVLIQNKHDFFEWFVSKIKDYINYPLIMDSFYSNLLIKYIFDRCTIEFENMEGVVIGEDGFGSDVAIAITELVRRIKNTKDNEFIWSEIIRLSQESNITGEEIFFVCNLVQNHVDEFPGNLTPNLLLSLFTYLERNIGDNQDSSNLMENMSCIYELYKSITRKKKFSYFVNIIDELKKIFRILLLDDSSSLVTLEFIKSYTLEFGSEKSNYMIDEIIYIYEQTDLCNSKADTIFEVIFRTNNYLKLEQRLRIVNKIIDTYQENSFEKINKAKDLLEKIVDIYGYKKVIRNNVERVISVTNDSIEIFTIKFDLAIFLVIQGLYSGNKIIYPIIENFPYGNELPKIQLILKRLDEIAYLISNSYGEILIDTLLINIENLKDVIFEVLKLVSYWINYSTPNNQEIFDTQIDINFESNPLGYLPLLRTQFENLSNVDLTECMLKIIFHINDAPDFPNTLREIIKTRCISLGFIELLAIIEKIIAKLNDRADLVKIFLEMLIPELNSTYIGELRMSAMGIVRVNGVSPISRNWFTVIELSNNPKIKDRRLIIKLFDYLFGGAKELVIFACEYALTILSSVKLTDKDKGIIAEFLKMAKQRLSDDEVTQLINDIGKKLDLKWFDN
jgi:hypothetical protein